MKLKIINNSVSISLPSQNLKNSDYYLEKPFVIFSIENFIDKEEIYKNFISEVKSLFEAKEKNLFEGKAGKKV